VIEVSFMALACTPKELFEITGKKQGAAQIRALRAMGIEHKPRPDGTPFVHRAHVDHLLGAADAKPAPESSEWEPNYAELG
jgi:Domain of unknown function (DUF4224)